MAIEQCYGCALLLVRDSWKSGNEPGMNFRVQCAY